MRRKGMLAFQGVVLSGAVTSLAWAEPPEAPRALPPIPRTALAADSFDVRAFDPVGMKPLAPPPASGARVPLSPRTQEAHTTAGSGLFSDGWRRDGFGSQPGSGP